MKDKAVVELLKSGRLGKGKDQQRSSMPPVPPLLWPIVPTPGRASVLVFPFFFGGCVAAVDVDGIMRPSWPDQRQKGLGQAASSPVALDGRLPFWLCLRCT